MNGEGQGLRKCCSTIGTMRGSATSLWRLARRARLPFQPPAHFSNNNTALSIARRLCATAPFRRNDFSSSRHPPPFRFSTGQSLSSSIFLNLSNATAFHFSPHRATQDHVHPNAGHAQSLLSHVLSRQACHAGWKRRLPQPSLRHEFSPRQIALRNRRSLSFLSSFAFPFSCFVRDSIQGFYRLPPSLPCRRYSRFLWIRFRYRYEIGRRCLGISETRGLCRYYGFLLFRSASLFRFSSRRRHGHRYPPSKHFSIIRETL